MEAPRSSGRSILSIGAPLLVALVLLVTLGAWLRSRDDRTVLAGSTGSPTGAASATPPPSPSPIPASVVRHPEILRVGAYSLTVGGVPFSFDVSKPGWERFGSISINKSTAGSQDAEAMILWTSFPDAVIPDPCADLLDPEIGPSVADLADAVSTAPGTSLVTGPSDVTVGGRASTYVSLTVARDIGCDPGFFFTWRHERWGAFWAGTRVGDTISMWIIDVDGRHLVIEVQSHHRADAELEQEIQQIVESVRFANVSTSPETLAARWGVSAIDLQRCPLSLYG